MMINGVEKTKGIISINIKIFDIEKNVKIFVIDNDKFQYDFSIGLDIIREFNLVQDENLRIKQMINKNITTNTKVNNYTINFKEHINTTNFNI